ncbi:MULTISPECIES: EthD family reductase [Bradyrhizobium]|uniref:EthD family reductase n=1 Tax=Bradyrhizobium TaxID=374 RepID=UPI001CD3FE70|nr:MULTISPECIES: EthD family reductase [unclassified Bradyrhizobium]MCA1424462.1 EthD family reductase [Bradyrhizobium sp. NBAIM16]MCA1502931.1 EthD family reductase [Bradyrhizobium sp. NBAIM02]UWU87110.1 EthD family reductase [Bradyrhizobium sp. CB1024]
MSERNTNALLDRSLPDARRSIGLQGLLRRQACPLAATLPGLVRHHYAFPQRLGPGEAPFCIFQAFFPDAAAMDAALGSEIGRKVAADVPNYSPKGATLCHFKIEGA